MSIQLNTKPFTRITNKHCLIKSTEFQFKILALVFLNLFLKGDCNFYKHVKDNVKDIHIKNVFQYIKVIESFSMRMLKSVFVLRRGVVVSGAVV